MKLKKILTTISSKLNLTRRKTDSDVTSIDSTLKQQPLRKKNNLKIRKINTAKWKYALSGLALFILIMGSFAVYFLSQQDQDIRQQASSNSQKVDLVLNPNNITAKKDQIKKITLTFDTNTAHMAAADITLSFNKNLISIISISPKDLPNTLSAPQITDGQAKFTFAAPPSSGGLSGTGTLAEIEIKLLQDQDASIIIDQTTQIAVTELSTNAVGNITNNKIKVQTNSSPSPSPSSSPNVSPSPSPSVSPSPSPSVNPSPTPNTGGTAIKICNEACGSSADCDVNLRCYNSQCRLVTNVGSSTCEENTGSNNDLTQEDITPVEPDQNNQEIAEITSVNCNDSCSTHDECHNSLSCFNGNCRLLLNPKSTSCSTIKTEIINIESKLEKDKIDTPIITSPSPTTNTNSYTPPQVQKSPLIETKVEKPQSTFQKFIAFIKNIFS